MNNDTLERRYQTCLLMLLVITLGIVLWGSGSIPLMSLNEARRAVPVDGMFRSHNWLLPYLNGQLYVDKPPFFYWVTLLFATASNTVNEWVLRLPSACAALATMLAAYVIARDSLGKWPALFTGVILATCTNFVIFARRGEIEMLLTALCAGSLFFAHQFIVVGEKTLSGKKSVSAYCTISTYFSYALMGAALLCKGPVALLFVHLPVLLMAWQNPRARTYLACWQGWLLMLVIGLSWYAVVTHDLGMDVWHRAFQADIQQKVAGKSNRDPFYDYLLFLLPDFLPWTLLVLFTPRKNLQQWLAHPSLRFFFYAAVVPLVTLSLFSNKHAKYLLPAYPAFALLAGHVVAGMFTSGSLRMRQLLAVITVLSLSGYLVFFAVFEKKVFHYRYSAMTEIARLASAYPEANLSSLQELDMRTVYYYGRPINILNPTDISNLASNNTPQLLLLEKDSWLPLLNKEKWQELERITPYISKKQTAVVLGNAAFFSRYKTPAAMPVR